jgi:hypothetical protein
MSMVEFKALDDWQRQSRKSDAQTADLIKVNRSTFSRFRNGLQTLKMRDLLKLEDVTGITPAECAEFYAKAVKQQGEGVKKNESPAAAEPEGAL